MVRIIPKIEIERYASPVVSMCDKTGEFVGFIYNEHEFNKVRIKMMEAEATDLFYFTWENKGETEKITVDSHGKMSNFPRGLYDQALQDMGAIFKLSKKNSNERV